MATALGPQSSRVTCPSCHQEVMTSTMPRATVKTHILALILCVLMCPECRNFIGTFEN